jgi:hypothetical protein
MTAARFTTSHDSWPLAERCATGFASAFSKLDQAAVPHWQSQWRTAVPEKFDADAACRKNRYWWLKSALVNLCYSL